MGTRRRGGKRSTYGDAFDSLHPSVQDEILAYLSSVAKGCIQASHTLRGQIDQFQLAADVVQQALVYQVRRGHVQVWTRTDLRNVAAWKVRNLVEQERAKIRRQIHRTGPHEPAIFERHYEDEAAHEEHGPSFKARVQEPAPEHVGANPEDPFDQIDLMDATRQFFEQRTRIRPQSISDIIEYLEFCCKHEVKLTPKGQIAEDHKRALLENFGWTTDHLRRIHGILRDHREALVAWLAARGYERLRQNF